jgi:glucose-1-phosphate cytidylyltransferase
MRTVILAGGKGTRLAEETGLRPKPMVEIGGRPILWHIMSLYARHGHKDFLVACGYKGDMIKEYFHRYHAQDSDFFVDLRTGKTDVIRPAQVDWRVGVIDTGQETMTGGRLLRLREMLGNEPFMLTYGDGLGSVDIGALVAFHRAHGKLATVTAVHPPARFGDLNIEGDRVRSFTEKPQTGEGWINGGFFVFEPGVLDYIAGEETSLEREPLSHLASDGQLMAYRHDGFWQPMDTVREKQILEQLWADGTAPWKAPS